MKKILTSPWTALITLAIVLAIRIADPVFVESVRLRYFDTLITSKAPTENNIYTVNIDEAALAKYGQYPFDRKVYAELIQDLYRRHAGLVVFNIVMSEKDRQGGDSALAQTLKKYPVVLSNIPANQNKNIPHPPGSAIVGAEHSDLIVQYPGLIANIPELEYAAQGSGIVNTLPEVDGVVRRMPLVVAVDGKLYPALSFETLMIAEGNSNFQVKMSELGIEKMRGPGAIGILNTDSLGRIWIDSSQQNHSVSMTKLPDNFNGAIVIVGVTAAGIANPVPTSRGAVWPQDVQASIMGTLINGVNIQRPAWADGAELVGLALLSVVLLFLTRYVYVGIISSVIIIFGVAIGSHYAYSQFLWLIDITSIVAGLILVTLHAYGIKFVSEFLQKQQIKKQFGSYVNPTIVERLQKDPSLIKLGGERKELSIVMTDLRGFTTLGESFGDDVEGLTQIMNDYMTALSVPVLKNDGTLIKFIGDASLHVHGAPLDDEQHAKSAVKTALEMIQAIEEFNQELTAKGRPPVGMGAGVNTGETLIGNIGAKTKFGYDVLGDSVSTAARLEGQTKSYGVLLIIGPRTAELVRDSFPVVKLDNIAVKGKTIGLDIYTVGKTVGYKHEEYMKEYLRGNWTKALKWAKELAVDPSVEIQEYYVKMIERLEEGLPANWSGTYVATSK